MKHSFFLVPVLLLLCPVLRAQENPFIAMASQPYSAYCDELERQVYKKIELRDSTWAAQTAAQMREAAKRTGQRKWGVEADYFEYTYHFSRSSYLHKPNKTEAALRAEAYIEELQTVIRQAQRIGADDLRWRAMFSEIQLYMGMIENYELGFRCCMAFDKELACVTAGEFPLRTYYYSSMSLYYYRFREYETAAAFCLRVIETPGNSTDHREHEQSWNTLGLIYRNHYHDLAKADSCFQRIVELRRPMVLQGVTDDIWVAIAQGNIGYNDYLRRDYVSAIPLLQKGMRGAVKNNPYNYNYASGMALALAAIFTTPNHLPVAKAYIDTARLFLDESARWNKVVNAKIDLDKWLLYYDAQRRYAEEAGALQQALYYADSALAVRSAYDNGFNTMQLLRAEQRVYQDELEAEQARNAGYRRSIWMLSGFLAVVIALLGWLYYSYRSKRAAYRELVRKSREWAQAPSVVVGTQNGNLPDAVVEIENEKTVFSRLEAIMAKRELFRNSNLTSDHLAGELHLSRHQLSQVINRCAGQNFFQYLNDYRIREVIRMMSDKALENASLEELAELSGFNSRASFYRVFREKTGLTPKQFRKNKND